jgi:tyrosyl-tRNA synthetase
MKAELSNKLDRMIDWESSITERSIFYESLESGQHRIKFGADITAPDLHLGHAVNLRVMRTMQDMGHKVVFLLGGFTTKVGDPSGRAHSRDTITTDPVIDTNKLRFVEQVKSILLDNPDTMEFRDNEEWWSRMSLQDFFGLLGSVSVQELTQRSTFKKRIEANQPLRVSEFLYPILQGYDSVETNSTITIVGSDQMFNEKMAWRYQQEARQERQMIICTKITPGLDGGQKQSKSLGNYIGLGWSAEAQVAGLMKLQDAQVRQWLEVYSSATRGEISDICSELRSNPIDAKLKAANLIVAEHKGPELANAATIDFKNKLDRKTAHKITESVRLDDGKSTIRELLHSLGYKSGNIRQMMDKNSILIDGTPIEDIDAIVITGNTVSIGKKRDILAS